MVSIGDSAIIRSNDTEEMTISSPIDIPKMAEWSGFTKGIIWIWWEDNLRRGRKTLTLKKPIPAKLEDTYDA